ncbi:flagellar basal body-associated protein FliL [Shewanella intestini]|uniref:Flagellar protein FliL n=1 Tax=Shewanella intestini TaxID=2017544 RepID=A0ABS5I004_9GAMM|nr:MULTISPECIES: flagellar basal body-associated protein FliL [Shewanella]MBR9727332.1 flagellar basal body-associated protein FliL [Shewanella intestini]MRG35618.1 flagellar basal body-associated protein FliL [Shewanella sp. XMDDZSB0408]
MAEQELELNENGAGKKSKKLLFIIIGVVLVAGIGVGAWLFLSGGSNDATPTENAEVVPGETANVTTDNSSEANYVGMPRPFLFNLPGLTRSRLVEIKVQLMVRGDDDVLTKKHIPLIEDALLTTFSAADYEKLSTQVGKDELRKLALLNVQNTLQAVTGRKVVEKVLFTGFVMQ